MSEATEYLLPEWVKTLRALVPLAATIGTTASNPQEWLTAFIKTVVAEWVVGGILDAATYVLGWFIFAYERVRSIILDAVPPLTAPIRIIESAIVGAVETFYGAILGVAQLAGLAGPPAAAVAIVIMGTLVVGLGYATFRVIPGSDAVEGFTEAFR